MKETINWHSVEKEGFPKKSGVYMVKDNHDWLKGHTLYCYHVLEYSVRHECFNAYDGSDTADYGTTNVAYWAAEDDVVCVPDEEEYELTPLEKSYSVQVFCESQFTCDCCPVYAVNNDFSCDDKDDVTVFDWLVEHGYLNKCGVILKL